MRALHVVPARPYGGMQKLVEQVCAALRRLNVDARVLALYEHPVFCQNLTQLAVPWRHTGEHQPWDPVGWVRLGRAVREFNPEVIHLHSPLLWSTVTLALVSRIPWVFHEHSIPTFFQPWDWKREVLKKLICARVDAIVGVSQHVTKSAQHHYQGARASFHCIYNGISGSPGLSRSITWPDFMGEVPPGRPLVGMLCRFAPGMGIEEFIEAIPIILKKLPEARFVLGGDGPMLSWARAERDRLRLNQVLSLPGFIQDIWQFWAELDFALFTSPNEPFGLRILEPQAMGVPVLGYRNYSGSDELIDHGVSGILIGWRQADQIAEEMLSLWREPERREALTTSALERLTHKFSIDRMGRECLNLYQELLP
jgi:glycosyltransferase involved in cell wall biosynthesis